MIRTTVRHSTTMRLAAVVAWTWRMPWLSHECPTTSQRYIVKLIRDEGEGAVPLWIPESSASGQMTAFLTLKTL
jgi:hypothetical protein